MAVERTLVLIKPDAVRARPRRRDPRPLRARAASRCARRRLLDVDRDARRGALRRARREAVLRRARRVHHLGADARARPRGRGRDRDRPLRRWARPTRPTPRRARSAATSRSSMPDNLVHGSDSPESAAREIALWFAAMSSSDARRNRAALGPDERRVPGSRTRELIGRPTSRAGGCGSSRSRSSGSSATSPGKDVLELGCGAAQWSILLAGRGARPVGARQLGAAARARARADRRRGSRLPARPRARRARAAARRELRRRLLRPRRDDRSPTRTGPSPRRRGCCAPAACSRSALDAARDHVLDETGDRSSRGSQRPYFGMHRIEERRTGRSSSTSRTASGSASSARTASSRGPARDPAAGGRRVDATARRRRPSGRGSGRWSRSGCPQGC